MYMHYFMEYLRGLMDRTNCACNQLNSIFNKFSILSKSDNFGLPNAV